MILEKVISYLNASNDISVSAYAETPQDRPESYIVIEQIAGSEQNQLLTTRLAVQSIDTRSLYNAALLNEKVKKAMNDIVALDAVSGVRLNSDYNFTNTATKEYRYQAVFDIYHYKED